MTKPARQHTPRPSARWMWAEGTSQHCVRLTGEWNLLVKARERSRLREELAQLRAPQTLAWDLHQIEHFDSAAALLLWELWGRDWPADLRCEHAHRRWFERLASAPHPEREHEAGWSYPLERLGQRVAASMATVGGMLLLVGESMLDLGFFVAHPRAFPWQEISAAVFDAGAQSLLLLGLVGFLIGIVMTLQLGMSVAKLGADQMVIHLVGLSVLRELGPVIAAIIVTGRSGSVITANIGAMHITQEFNALRTFGASPRRRLVFPQIVALALSLPMLVVWTDIVALAGGMVTAQAYMGVSHELFLQQLPQEVQTTNFWLGLGKGAVYGITVAVVACYYGLKATPSTAGLSRQITKSVVVGLALILLMDAGSGALLANVGLI